MENEPLYTPLFCEENIWQLARRLLDEGVAPHTVQVLFFSNRNRSVVMLHQQTAGERGFVVWDYHVVLQVGPLIYDFDTTLPFPVAAAGYLGASFPEQSRLDPAYRAWVRVVPAASYVTNLYSDRSHMQGVVASSAFPPWPLITPDHDHTVALNDYIDMDRQLGDGSRVVAVAAYLRSLQEEGDVGTNRSG